MGEVVREERYSWVVYRSCVEWGEGRSIKSTDG